jgi:hypothetical protein
VPCPSPSCARRRSPCDAVPGFPGHRTPGRPGADRVLRAPAGLGAAGTGGRDDELLKRPRWHEKTPAPGKSPGSPPFEELAQLRREPGFLFEGRGPRVTDLHFDRPLKKNLAQTL